MANMSKLVVGGVLGAAAAYFLDPDQGARRRNQARDQAMAQLRRGGQELQGKTKHARGVAEGLVKQVKPATPEAGPAQERPDDATLARKVESIVFRDEDAPKDKVSINAENGVVYLRGELESPEQIEGLVEEVRRVDGVSGVESLLHTPGEPAPMKS